MIVTTIALQAEVQQAAPNSQFLIVDSLVTTPEYDKRLLECINRTRGF